MDTVVALLSWVQTVVAAEGGKKSDLLGGNTAIEDADHAVRTIIVTITEEIDREIGDAETALALMIERTLSVIGALGADAGDADEVVGTLSGIAAQCARSIDTEVGGTLIVIGTVGAGAIDTEIGRALEVVGAVCTGIVETEVAFTLSRIGTEGGLDEGRGRRLVGCGRGGGVVGAGDVTGDVI